MPRSSYTHPDCSRLGTPPLGPPFPKTVSSQKSYQLLSLDVRVNLPDIRDPIHPPLPIRIDDPSAPFPESYQSAHPESTSHSAPTHSLPMLPGHRKSLNHKKL
jgi:hypothetical protein